ncbi:MAG: hypothetical protein IJN63_05365 [Clostridia bacterium]|nr:hypothetical protein [Clostridia bacterium]
MKKTFSSIAILTALLCTLCSCSSGGGEDVGITTVYAVSAFLSIAMLFSYCVFLRRKNDLWFTALFSSVALINLSYFLLSVSNTIDGALMCNRFAYLGSVFLPMAMLMIILRFAKIKYTKTLPTALFIIGFVILLIAASPGILPIYYKDAFIEKIGNATVLRKEYGPLHPIYMVYLFGYFAAIVYTVFRAVLKKKVSSNSHAFALFFAVFINIVVWTVEQFIDNDIELLSISYMISEFFLLSLDLMCQEHSKQLKKALERAASANTSTSDVPARGEVSLTDISTPDLSSVTDEKRIAFIKGINNLTKSEALIYDMHMEGKSTKEIMAALSITENTLKFHNKNLYGKLCVSSRKELRETAIALGLQNAKKQS